MRDRYEARQGAAAHPAPLEERDRGIVALKAQVRKGRVVKYLSKLAAMITSRFGAERRLIVRQVEDTPSALRGDLGHSAILLDMRTRGGAERNILQRIYFVALPIISI